MKDKTEDFISRLETETNELGERFNKLQSFIFSDAFKAVDPVQQKLLHEQREAMHTLRNILIQRHILLVGGPNTDAPEWYENAVNFIVGEEGSEAVAKGDGDMLYIDAQMTREEWVEFARILLDQKS